MTSNPNKPITSKQLQVHLREYDVSRVYLKYIVRFVPFTPRDRIKITYDRTKLELTLSALWKSAPLDVAYEVVEYAYLRSIGRTKLKFGPLARKYQRESVARRVRSNPVDPHEVVRDKTLSNVKKRVHNSFPSCQRTLKSVITQWNIYDEPPTKGLIASHDIHGRIITFNRVLKSDNILPVVKDYILFHELCVFRSWDYSLFKCDREKLESLLNEYPQRPLVLTLLKLYGWTLSDIT